MSKQSEIGSTNPTPGSPGPQLRDVALVQLIATVTLALCTLIIATAVSIGLVRAEFAPVPGSDMAPIAVMLSPMDDAAFRA